jgi:nucleoside-diphosphate-sugar epimerase
MTTNLKDLPIAIIGGAGFIGHNLAIHLKSRGANVSVIDGLEVNNLVSLASNSDNVPYPDLSIALVNERFRLLREKKIPLLVQDARDYHGLSHLLNRLKPHVIVHLAAVSHATRSNKNPFSTFDHSLRTLENALDFTRTQSSRHFIFLSSSMAYGNFDGDSVTEESPCNPLGIYGTLKLCGEKIVYAYNQVFDMPYTIVRPSALYGERCVSRRVGQVFIESALCGDDIFINGDGSERLDFTYIEDLLQGITLCIERDAARNQIFNLTFGNARSVREMAEILEDEFPGIKIQSHARDNFSPERGTLCVDKAKRLLGYEPQFSIERGYRQYIQWYKSMKSKQPELFKLNVTMRVDGGDFVGPR